MKTTIVIVTRQSLILSLCLNAHLVYSGTDISFVIVTTVPKDDPNDEEMELDRIIGAHEGIWPIEVIGLDGKDPWYGQACDIGTREAIKGGAEFIVFENDDAMVVPNGSTGGWLEVLKDDYDLIAQSGYKPGLVGACSNAISGPQASIGAGMPYGNGPIQGPMHCPRVVPILALCSAAAYDDVGGFDTDLPAHQFSDDALSCRFMRKGYSNWTSRAFVAHAGSQTLKPGSDLWRSDLVNGKEYFDKAYPDWETLKNVRPTKS